MNILLVALAMPVFMIINLAAVIMLWRVIATFTDTKLNTKRKSSVSPGIMKAPSPDELRKTDDDKRIEEKMNKLLRELAE